MKPAEEDRHGTLEPCEQHEAAFIVAPTLPDELWQRAKSSGSQGWNR